MYHKYCLGITICIYCVVNKYAFATVLIFVIAEQKKVHDGRLLIIKYLGILNC